jgi:hypothetical protein
VSPFQGTRERLSAEAGASLLVAVAANNLEQPNAPPVDLTN